LATALVFARRRDEPARSGLALSVVGLVSAIGVGIPALRLATEAVPGQTFLGDPIGAALFDLQAHRATEPRFLCSDLARALRGSDELPPPGVRPSSSPKDPERVLREVPDARAIAQKCATESLDDLRRDRARSPAPNGLSPDVIAWIESNYQLFASIQPPETREKMMADLVQWDMGR
jgi:hypothetical protein